MLTRMPQPLPGWATDTAAPVMSGVRTTVWGVSSALSAFVLVAIVWVLLIGATLLVFRAILAEDLDGEDDQRDDPTRHDPPA